MKHRVIYRTKYLRVPRHKDFTDKANADLFRAYLKKKGINSIQRKVGPTVNIQYEVI